MQRQWKRSERKRDMKTDISRGRSDRVMMMNGVKSKGVGTAAALTRHLSVTEERREKEREGGVTV